MKTRTDLLGNVFYTYPGTVYAPVHEPEGIDLSKVITRFNGFYTSEDVLDRYYEGSLLQKAGVSRETLLAAVKQVELEFANHDFLWDGESLPLQDYTIRDGELVELHFYSRKYSFGQAVQRAWINIPRIERQKLLQQSDGVDGLLSSGFGVQGLIRTADNKMLTTIRSHSTIKHGGLFMTSFNEGAGLPDVANGTVNLTNAFYRGMAEELNIIDPSNIRIKTHTLMLDEDYYEWGLLAYVDASGTNLDSNALKHIGTSGEESWEHEKLLFSEFNPTELITLLERDANRWISHGLVCAALSGAIVHPEITPWLKKFFALPE